MVFCTDLLVMICTMSSAAFWSWLARFNVVGANPCARRAPLEMTRSEMVVKAKKAGRFSTDARYAGNRSVRQAFFFEKIRGKKKRPSAPPRHCGRRVLVVGKIIRRKSWRWN